MFADETVYLDSVEYVFTGKVIEIIEVPYSDTTLPAWMDTSANRQQFFEMLYPKRHSAKVIMIKNYKSTEPKQDTLFFEYGPTNCDPRYRLNQSYLFFAEEVDVATFKMMHCTPWGTIKETEEILKLYERLKN